MVMLTTLTFYPAVPHKAESIPHSQPPLPPLKGLLLPFPCSVLNKLVSTIFVLTFTFCLKTFSTHEHLSYTYQRHKVFFILIKILLLRWAMHE